MRIKLTLEPRGDKTEIPVNYQYPLSCVIYKILSKASGEYSDWLHNEGYISSTNRKMKLFVFSNLKINPVHLEKNRFTISRDSKCEFLISSPMLSSFVQNFVLGSFEAEEIIIANNDIKGEFRISKIQFIEDPEFSGNMKFFCLSPVAASTILMKDNKKQTYYFRPLDNDLSMALSKNLIEKYKISHDKEIADSGVEFLIDEEYIRKKGGEEHISKLITIKEGLTGETKIKGFIAPFILKGNPELIKTAYESGIGQYNSQGCGMIEVYNKG